ncbi:DNA mismatch repair protein MutS [Aureimonas jatrophae]|uniref:DNA mismatch repair protein MutS n=1 Tax=Aureimonas jatrophae TaxID=1166073 RepID=A0A1H0ILF0_9HYPH|nr:DNA mismatch repair protein MutS [Aureimonas jatrophae]MBB3952244.1 DNA mismatch repair protein MutS [Aureimonas jatrophae]SDO32309.1 DNA mismatch repair protein MutS [Aureimonas jatrophae]
MLDIARTIDPSPVEGAPTPMMAQYLEIKAAYPDALLFYRMGDFYELFFEDAVEASRALGITLTKRGKHLGADIPMAGVPVVSSDDYLQKLIAGGYRVAVCEQVEDPAEAKKRGGKSVVRRDVVRLVTPGTLTEEALLDPARANHLATLARIGGPRGAMAIAFCDLSTGLFRIAPTDEDRLFADIAAVDPSELVVPDTMREDEALRPLFSRLGRALRFEPAVLFDGASASERLCRFYGVATLDGFGAFERVEMAAGAALIGYLGRTQFEARPTLMRPERVEPDRFMLIDPATRASLELTRAVGGRRQGSLLDTIDRCVSGAGSRLLASRLAFPLTATAEIARRQDAVAWMTGDNRLRRSLREALKGLPDIERALSRLALDRGGPRDLGAVAEAGERARLLAGLLDGREVPAEVGEALADLAAPPTELAAFLGATLGDELPLRRGEGGFVGSGACERLDEARRLRDESRLVLGDLQVRYIAETGVRALKIRHNNVLGYFVEVPEAQGASLQATGVFSHRQTLASAMRFTTPELADLEGRIAEAGSIALKRELELFSAMRAAVLAAADELRRMADAFGRLDVAAALAELAVSGNWTRPIVDDSLAFRVEGGRHPVVEAALKRGGGAGFVANDCDLSPPAAGRRRAAHGAIWLLTGPNMGGKSTFLRQNALIAVLAQIGAFVPAAHAHIGVVDRLFSRVGASDDLAEGRSTFMVEMVETAAILNQAGERTLVVLDEIGRGTATYDGLSIAFAAVEHLHEVNRCRALFATHFHEMTALSARLSRLSNATVRVREWEGEVVFLHEVGPGVADRSYGIQVARLAGLPPVVLDRARQVLGELEKGERTGGGTLDDLPLFSAARAAAPPVAAARPPPALEALRAVDPDAMTPRDALETLYRLKGLLGS